MRSFLFLFLTFFLINNISAQEFEKFFVDNSMRVDFNLSGNSKEQSVFLVQVKREPFWGGSHKNLVDTFNFGQYYFTVKDLETDKIIYSRGFGTLFHEWQATKEAKEVSKSFYETLVFPYPIAKVKVEIFKREKNNTLTSLSTFEIDPALLAIINDKLDYETYKVHNSGESSKKLDIVIIPEGYTEKEMKKFKEDADRFAGYLFKYEPFKSLKDKINIWAIIAASEESGTDIPNENIWKNTLLSSNFYTFGIDRYLTTLDIKSVRDVAACVPYDQIYILVNTETYGGGGVYNYYSLCTSDNSMSEQVFVHEFGHGFAGLGDEYYTSDVAVEDYYSFENEPWEPNLTNLTDFDSKWKSMVDKKTPVPTPAEEKYNSTVGVFEGAGYVSKGLYRPYNYCIMREFYHSNGFCPVCQKAISDMIKFYSE